MDNENPEGHQREGKDNQHLTSVDADQIKTMDQQTGDDYDIIWADGTAEFTKVWDDRLSLTYN